MEIEFFNYYPDNLTVIKYKISICQKYPHSIHPYITTFVVLSKTFDQM